MPLCKMSLQSPAPGAAGGFVPGWGTWIVTCISLGEVFFSPFKTSHLACS